MRQEETSKRAQAHHSTTWKNSQHVLGYAKYDICLFGLGVSGKIDAQSLFLLVVN